MMATDPHTEAARWLVVGDASEVQRLTAMGELGGEAPPQVVIAPTFLAALGELGRQAASVVIGPLRGVEGMAAPMVQAMRELSPGARLVVIAESTDTSAAKGALEAGFDAVITAPLTSDRLRAALEGDPGWPRSRYVEAAAAGIDGDAVGDTDLIDSLLRGLKVDTVAMRVVEQRCDVLGVQWFRDEAEAPEEGGQARVSLRGREFGVLWAPPPALDAELEPWAAWLAHWMALDEQMGLLKDMSMRDPLTGVWNRRYFERFLSRILNWAGRERSPVTLLVFDIDDFKHYNDRYGHAAGDDILRETSRLMQAVVREHDVVARIGGDEFAVIFWDADAPRVQGSRHPQNVIAAARRFQKAIVNHRFPKLYNEAPGTLTISGGLASFPWDGRTPEELLDRADQMALQSKRRGKNAITFGPGAEQALREAGGA